MKKIVLLLISLASVLVMAGTAPRCPASRIEDYYKLLGLKQTASLKDVKKACRDFKRKYHPDKAHNLSDQDKREHKQKFEEYGNACATLESRFHDMHNITSNSEFIQKDYSLLNIEGRSFEGLRFLACDFIKTSFKHTQLNRVLFLLSNGCSVSFDHGHLSDVVFMPEINAERGIFFGGSIFDNASFYKTRMQEVVLVASSFKGAQFREAFLPKTMFLGVDLSYASFMQADLHQSIFIGSAEADVFSVLVELPKMLVQQVAFDKANLSEAKIVKTSINGSSFAKSNLKKTLFNFCAISETNFSASEAMHSNWEGSRLSDISFKNANLSYASFRGAQLSNISFDGAVLDYANFTGVDLSDIEFDKAASLVGIQVDEIFQSKMVNEAAQAKEQVIVKDTSDDVMQVKQEPAVSATSVTALPLELVKVTEQSKAVTLEQTIQGANDKHTRLDEQLEKEEFLAAQVNIPAQSKPKVKLNNWC